MMGFQLQLLFILATIGRPRYEHGMEDGWHPREEARLLLFAMLAPTPKNLLFEKLTFKPKDNSKHLKMRKRFLEFSRDHLSMMRASSVNWRYETSTPLEPTFMA